MEKKKPEKKEKKKQEKKRKTENKKKQKQKEKEEEALGNHVRQKRFDGVETSCVLVTAVAVAEGEQQCRESRRALQFEFPL